MFLTKIESRIENDFAGRFHQSCGARAIIIRKLHKNNKLRLKCSQTTQVAEAIRTFWQEHWEVVTMTATLKQLSLTKCHRTSNGRMFHLLGSALTVLL